MTGITVRECRAEDGCRHGLRGSGANRPLGPGQQLASKSDDRVVVGRLNRATEDADRVTARARMIESYLPTAAGLARRFSGRGEPLADLTQVAVIGLIKAVDGFDADRGSFRAYAVPTILGEIKRHFRDSTWTVRVPRGLRDLRQLLAMATEQLTHALSRAPTIEELADRLHVSEDDVVSAQQCASARRPLSLERPARRGGQTPLVDSIGGNDSGFERADGHEILSLLRRRLAQLPERERRIINLRYFGGLTQAEIAVEVGVSQMQVSRLLARTLARLREAMVTDLGGKDAGGGRFAVAPTPHSVSTLRQ